jgi:hypothetical protein
METLRAHRDVSAHFREPAGGRRATTSDRSPALSSPRPSRTGAVPSRAPSTSVLEEALMTLLTSSASTSWSP